MRYSSMRCHTGTIKGSYVTENIRIPVQTQVVGPKLKYVLGVNQALGSLESLASHPARNADIGGVYVMPLIKGTSKVVNIVVSRLLTACFILSSSSITSRDKGIYKKGKLLDYMDNKERITLVVNHDNSIMLSRVWPEFDYRIYVYRVTG
ncbi:hypothetical protein TNCV_2915801 [Trichonephila clavipes]|nr:hypothetical protein TNCV_2915801 [Trichonephila clavipes]